MTENHPKPKTLNAKLYVRLKRGENGDYYWSAHHHSNGKSMAIGGEGYRTKRSCLHGINTVFDKIAIFEQKLIDGKSVETRVR